jgi:hypothetical protein
MVKESRNVACSLPNKIKVNKSRKWDSGLRNNIMVTAVLRSIPKEAFADSFQKLYERCQPCVVKDGDYFEGQQI